MKVTKELTDDIETFNKMLQKTLGMKTLFSIVIFDETGVLLASNTDKKLALNAIEAVLEIETVGLIKNTVHVGVCH